MDIIVWIQRKADLVTQVNITLTLTLTLILILTLTLTLGSDEEGESYVFCAECPWSDMYTGECGAFQKETENWCDTFCCSESGPGGCCVTDGGAVAGLAVGLILFISLIVYLSCYFIPSCIWHNQIRGKQANITQQHAPVPVPQSDIRPTAYTYGNPQAPTLAAQQPQHPAVQMTMPPTAPNNGIIYGRVVEQTEF